ncbi:helix-turn-helix domain-containing protein [Dactylosporangium sp. CA-139066]|uniref:helix-turn-helix domain-containing protein n=1 Tax=Dactylosporangium sp. CA-139066 TaxID=3239930 RepID=UPI003D915AFA
MHALWGGRTNSWTVEELAAFLRLPPATIYRWRYRSIGPWAFKVGRHLQFREADVHTWLENQAA